MSSQTLFLSDLHLSEQNPSITRSFKDFVQHCLHYQEHIHAIYILGDLFEFWIGDDFQTDFIKDIIGQLKQLSQTGIQCFIMHGNRDFLIGNQFEKLSGFQLVEDPYVLFLDDKRIILSHGDDLCTDDIAYQDFKKMVRNPAWQDEFLSQNIETRIQIALNAREESKQNQQNMQESIADVNQQAVEQLLIEHTSSCLIHGHTHRPDIHTFMVNGHKAIRYVLSAWYQQGSYLKYSNHKFESVNI